MTTFPRQAREHISDGTSCWCKADVIDGNIVVHQDDLSVAFGLHAVFLETHIGVDSRSRRGEADA